MDSDNQIIIPVPEDKVFYLQEHEQFKPELMPYIASLNLGFVETEYEGEPKYLGILTFISELKGNVKPNVFSPFSLPTNICPL